jgi:hypothetical protein
LSRDVRTGRPIPDVLDPHTQLGRRTSRRTGETYVQAREFGAGGVHIRDVDFADHHLPGHVVPHQHRIDLATGKRLAAESL